MDIDKNHEMISTGYSNMTPWRCPRDIDDQDLYGKLDNLAGKSKRTGTAIFNLHAPPYDSGLDTAPKLDENLRPVLAPGGKTMDATVGSKAVREILLKYQPLLSLHGHIHESKGFTRIGRTTCLNPGSEYGDGVLKGVLVDLDAEQVKGYVFTDG